jgi:transcriptional regulator with XRE-family HTH domain
MFTDTVHESGSFRCVPVISRAALLPRCVRRYTGFMSAPVARDVAAVSTEAGIGEVLKRLREQSGLSLRTRASQAGFSASFLSQVENGQVSPSLASLERVAAALSVTLADVFEASERPAAAVVRATARPGFTSSWSRARIESLSPASARGPLEAIAVTLSSKGESSCTDRLFH